MASLTLTEAEHILTAAKAKVLEMGAKMSVSVVDPRGSRDGRRTDASLPSENRNRSMSPSRQMAS